MGRLKQAPSRFVAAPGRLGSAPQSEAERSRQRRIQSPWRNWYNTARWKDLRWDVLESALFTCGRCGHLEGDTSKLVADHIIPHRGDEGRFWDRSNLQCLCKGCHDRVKQAEERRGLHG
ncbi:HNH endonuclease [Rhodobacter sp. 24-YEA-8]|uniref:HNH endonuclease n=1 Tax=Rhodobacter sp. 24-YEA-8 TaxID=1884310 RepID=UPI00089D4697|nr:HNH endonuclease signature motif containing protein [Rhodobacter sp. 24-YEA-8]SEB78901.1 HNH endonuclease [Rhodobacter sp. 24-YEA-8]